MYDILRSDRMYDEIEVIDDCAFLHRTGTAAIDPYGEGWWDQDYDGRISTLHLNPPERVLTRAKRATPTLVKEFVQARRR